MFRGFVNSWVTRYNHDKFWKMYMRCQSGEAKGLVRILYIYRLKRISSQHNCDLMITQRRDCPFGAQFDSPPFLHHGLNGIVISRNAQIGAGATILQQVTIGIKNIGNPEAPCIGKNVFIGAGAKIIGGIIIGDNVKIGANAVVNMDVPDDVTVVGNPGVIKEKVI